MTTLIKVGRASTRPAATTIDRADKLLLTQAAGVRSIEYGVLEDQAVAASESAATAVAETVATATAEPFAATASTAAQNALSAAALAGSFATKADADAALADYTDGQSVEVTSDSTASLNGLYARRSAAWVQISTATVAGIDTRLSPVEAQVTPAIGAVQQVIQRGDGVYGLDAARNIIWQLSPTGMRYRAAVTLDRATLTQEVLPAGVTRVALTPQPYARSLAAYARVEVDANRRILSAVPLYAPASADAAEAVQTAADYVVYAALDGEGDSQVYSEHRTTGVITQLSAAGSNNTAPVLLGPDAVGWTSDRASGPPLGHFWSPLSAPRERALRPYGRITCLGDSMTFRGYPETLEDILGVQVTNRGVNGDTSTRVAARLGYVPARITVSGNEIAASGDTAITAYSSNPTNLAGTLAGVPGYLRASGSGISFERTGSGSATACPPGTPFVPDRTGWDEEICVLWAGHNNPGELRRYLDEVAAFVAFLSTYGKRFLILPYINSADEPIGSIGYKQRQRHLAALLAAYPDNVVDPMPTLLAAADPEEPQDVIDAALGVVPASLRVDSLHLTEPAGYAVVAQFVADAIQARGWL
ncbi:SGNH/GDSL hydrolase family protein [Falsiroseomonas selenitidurans]|uniref:SGNH hydrolase-type esterase domain-containing protein n=1 Tax=Falsiroseomonas selenitidurans TaxID=2716335 RepID=A0ABX1EC98_9PROT|nr:hypothetical protein [Falsiroseomonas selenitidurans]NKC33507.1 hypothetical protein [Falsiroseomonas selenitidurans]